MEKFLNFVQNYYIIFIILSIFLIFGIIGYIIDNKRRKSNIYKLENEDIDIENLNIDGNISLKEMVNKSYNMNSGINMNVNDSINNNKDTK